MTLEHVHRSIRKGRIVALVGALAMVSTSVARPGIRNAAATEAPPAATSPTPVAPDRASARVIFGVDTVFAEVAQTPDERAEGLMYREQLPEDSGMLFLFPETAVRGFWMQNTYLPLDIAFLDASFRIVDIQQMEPLTTDQHTARAPFMYALEVNQGWFEAHGVTVGTVAEVVFGR